MSSARSRWRWTWETLAYLEYYNGTPERGEKYYGGANKLLTELAGGTVRVESGLRAQDHLGRSLWYIYTEDGESIEEALIREGLGLAWTRDGQHSDYLISL